MPDASSFFIPHLEIHAEHMEFDALLPHSKSMWTSYKGTSARKRFSTTLVQVEILSNYASTHTRIVKVKRAAEILPPVHREDLCVLVSTEKENIELESSPIWMQGSILGAGNLISVSSSDNVLQAAKAAALFPSSFATGDVLLNLD